MPPEGNIDIIPTGPVTGETAKESLDVDGRSGRPQPKAAMVADALDGIVARILDAVEPFA